MGREYGVLIVDDEPLALQGMDIIVRRQERLTVIGKARSVTEALGVAAAAAPDIMLVDIRLRGESGLDLIRQVHRLHPCTKSIIVTAFPEFSYAQAAVALSVSEYLLKPITPGPLTRALQRVIKELDSLPEDDGGNRVSGLLSRASRRHADVPRQSVNPHVRDAIAMIEADPARSGPEALANSLFISKHHLCRLFKKHTGKTVEQFIMETRISAAERLIMETNEPLLVIARALGFKDPGHFSRVFRRLRGVSPSSLRTPHTD